MEPFAVLRVYKIEVNWQDQVVMYVWYLRSVRVCSRSKRLWLAPSCLSLSFSCSKSAHP